MSDDRWERIQEIFEGALDLDGAARDAFLREACRGDDALVAEVESLLEADERGYSFLDTPGPVPMMDEDDDLPAGTEIGPYRVSRVIGEGGMGMVYLAERADGEFQQQVALKVIKRGMDTHDILARFRGERQILARLQHANIARLLDGGVTKDGLPWFAMEYVDGKSIDAHCDQGRLGIDARLDLFTTVCGAVQYAHANLVVHRDLKPDNILVTADGTVKLLDFGIGKVLEGDDDGTRLTRVGSRVLTPAYASPEQLRGSAVSTATDIYSLGVVLFELLVGQRPGRGEGSGDDAKAGAGDSISLVTALRRGRRGEGGVDTDTLCTTRDTRLDKLERKVRGDLDVICQRALQDDPERRFASVEALAGDVRRHREGLPVLARPDSLMYRARKFVSRNLAAVLVTVAMVSVVITLVSFYTVRLRAERARARFEATNSADVADFLVNLFRMASPQTEKPLTTARQLLDQAVAGFDTLAVNQPKLYSNLLMSTGMVYRELGDLKAAEPQLRKLVHTNEHIFDGPAVLSIQAKSQLATTLQEEGKLREAIPFFESALAEARALPEKDPIAVAYCLNNLAKVHVDLADYARAEGPLREAAEIYSRNTTKEGPGWYGTAMRNLARTVRLEGRYQEADSLFRLSIESWRKGDTGSPSLAEGLYEAAALRLDLDDLVGADTLAEEALRRRRYDYPDGHASIGRSLIQLATVHRRAGDLRRASAEVAEGDSILRAHLPATHSWIAEAVLERGQIQQAEGRLDRAEASEREALSILGTSLGAEHPEYAWATVTLAGLLAERGECARALEILPSAVTTLEDRLGEGHPHAVAARALLRRCRRA
jgi:eukaryotic-like serine/threonine-protein kinase